MEPTIELEFVGEESPSRATELSYFLYLYKATYTIILEKFADLPIDKAIEGYESITKDAAVLLEAAQKGNRISTSFFSDLGERDLFVARIQKESPLLITLLAFGGVPLIAAIIAGGEIELGALSVRVKAKFNRLGDGIGALRDALQGKPRSPKKPKKRQ